MAYHAPPTELYFFGGVIWIGRCRTRLKLLTLHKLIWIPCFEAFSPKKTPRFPSQKYHIYMVELYNLAPIYNRLFVCLVIFTMLSTLLVQIATRQKPGNGENLLLFTNDAKGSFRCTIVIDNFAHHPTFVQRPGDTLQTVQQHSRSAIQGSTMPDVA